MSNNAIPQTGQQRERNENVEEDKTLRGQRDRKSVV